MSGLVTIDGAEARAARGTIVTINHTDHLYADTAVTDEQGRFVFRDVPAGRYQLAAEKGGYLTSRFGAPGPGRAGTPIAITDGQQLTGLALKIVKGSVLTGTVRDPDGDPASGVMISVKRFVSGGGVRRLVEAGSDGSSRTDDRGVFRLYGLPAGEYVLQVLPTLDFEDSLSSLHQTTTADVAWGRALVSSQAAGVGGSQPAPSPPPAGTVGYAPVYFPNTLQQSAAATIAVGPGEERSGLDFTLSLRPTFRVSGTVTAQNGSAPSGSPHLYLVEPGVDGGGWFGVKERGGTPFTFSGVAPGSYAIAAIVDETRMWAMTTVNVSNQDQSVSLTLQPGMSTAGRVVFQGTRPAPTDLTTVDIAVSALAIAGGLVVEPLSTNPKADGTFAVDGLMPGSYRLSAYLPGRQAGKSDWILRSAMVGDQDIADFPLEVRAGAEIGKVTVTFTDRPTELSGRLQDASGRAASDYFIIVFSADERTWGERSRRIAQTRPASDGRYVVHGLPPGEYLVAALTDVEGDEWHDTGFLRQLKATTLKTTLGEGERKILDIRIAGLR